MIENKPLKLIYVFDPLCGWCYGFSPIIKKLYKKFRTKIDFEVINGGMILGDKIGPISKISSYLNMAYKEVEERTGVKFGSHFLIALQEGNMVLTSLPPSRALTTFKSFRPHDAVLMAGEIQKAIYHEGHVPSDGKVYLALAEKFDLPVKEFEKRLWSEEIAAKTSADFQQAKALNVRSFPAVFLSNGIEHLPLVNGYCDYDELLMTVINGASYFEVDLV